MSELNFEHFAEHLRDRVSGFRRVYDEHVASYDEVLPHVLLGDLVRFLSAQVRAHGVDSAAVVDAIEILERGMGSSDRRLQNLIAVSFIENLDPQDEAFPLITKQFGPRLRTELERQMSGPPVSF